MRGKEKRYVRWLYSYDYSCIQKSREAITIGSSKLSKVRTSSAAACCYKATPCVARFLSNLLAKWVSHTSRGARCNHAAHRASDCKKVGEKSQDVRTENPTWAEGASFDTSNQEEVVYPNRRRLGEPILPGQATHGRCCQNSMQAADGR